jgi:hypothetical protein
MGGSEVARLGGEVTESSTAITPSDIHNGNEVGR